MAEYAVMYGRTDTGWSAHVPDLPGCIAAGSTFEETQRLIHEAIEQHLAGMREDGEPIPAPTHRAEMVKVPAR